MNENSKNCVATRGFVKENRSWSTQSWGSTIVQVLLGEGRRRTDQKQRTRRMRRNSRREGCALILNRLPCPAGYRKVPRSSSPSTTRVRIPHPPQYPSNSYIHPVMISPLSPSPSPSLITGVNWTGGVCMMQRVRQEKIAFPKAKRTKSAKAPNPHLLNVSSPSKRGKKQWGRGFSSQ